MILNGFAGPGGWDVALRSLGLGPFVGIEMDAAACLTRAAAGHLTIRADISRYPVTHLAGKVTGQVDSPPCVVFSGAGNRGGIAVMHVLEDLIRDMFAGRRTMAARRREMARVLRESGWPQPGPRPTRFGRTLNAGRKHKTPVHLTREERSRRIWKAVRSASLVAEPARFLHVTRPQWVAMEQVPAVLPLWRVYVAELRKLGYHAWCGKLNAADYGVPQTRERAILVASLTRKVGRPVPTHYDPRKGDQLWGTPWVSMATALGWGTTGRPGPAVTAGGTAAGGAEPFGHRDRDMLASEREAGRWALRIDGQDNATCRPGDRPAGTIKAGHSAAEMRWVLQRDRGAGMSERHGDREDRELDQPAPSITSGGNGNPRLGWVLHTNRGQEPDGTRQTVDPSSAPAPALTAKSGAQWKVKPREPEMSWFLRNNNNNACQRSLDEPAGTLFFSERSNWAAWVAERPSTTVCGDSRIGRPGHKEREPGGESQFAVDSVRISVEEAAILQSFPADYPWRGTKTAQYRQVGDAIPPLLAAHVIAEATGLSVAQAAA